MLEVICNQPCWDSKRAIRFSPGNKLIFRSDEEMTQAALEPISKYFEGWPEIPVYAKEKGIEGWRIGDKGQFNPGKKALGNNKKICEKNPDKNKG